MAELFSDMNDSRLKPPMLRSVVRDRLIDEKRPFPSSTEIASVISQVRTHGLLSERLSETGDGKLSKAWALAVDGWVERIVLLASSSALDKCWTGSCLLGVTCQECCSDRFQSSYTDWVQKLLENLQSQSSNHIIKVACCASLSDLFLRLSNFSNHKQNGIVLARKFVQPVLQLLNEDAGENEAAANLLCTLITFFPSSIQRHCDNVEAILISKIMTAKCNLHTSEKLSCSLAMLPKVKGDKYSWCVFIQKILVAINSILSVLFQGFEEERKSFDVMKIIVPPGKDPPPLLGGQTLSGESSESVIKRLSELLVPRVIALMHSCSIMLDNYPSEVSIPVPSLLATVGRVLQLDGSFRESMFPLATSMHQELLCAELPAVHLGSLDLLVAVVKVRSIFWSHGPSIVRLLTEYIRKARMPTIRIKVYSIVQMLLTSMGVGAALPLVQELINNAFSDLTDNRELGSSAVLSNTQSTVLVSETFQQNQSRKKRKLVAVTPLKYPNGVDLSVKPCSKKPQVLLSVKIAALKALEALLSMKGSSASAHWRFDVDCLVATVATNACAEGCENVAEPSLLENEPTFADLQLASLEVLLASLISYTPTRPPFLSQGFILFQRGMMKTGSKIAPFCAHACLVLDLIQHPRGLPLTDHLLHGTQSIDVEGFNPSINPNLPSNGDLALLDEEDEELSHSWLDKSDLIDNKFTENIKQSSPASEDIIIKDNVDAGMASLSRNEPSVDSEMAEELKPEDDSHNKIDFGRRGSFEMVAGESGSPLETPENADMSEQSGVLERLPDLNNTGRKDAVLSYHSDSPSLDSLPDIVDGDPDTE